MPFEIIFGEEALPGLNCIYQSLTCDLQPFGVQSDHPEKSTVNLANDNLHLYDGYGTLSGRFQIMTLIYTILIT